MLKKIFAAALVALAISPYSYAQSNYSCTGPGLNKLMAADLSKFRKEKLEAGFARAMGGADAYAYYDGEKIKVITAAFSSNAGTAEMNFYLANMTDYLMEYHIVQNSNFYGEPDSVVLTDERSYYHVCDSTLLSPAFGGIINEEVYDNMKLVLDVILTEEGLK